MRRTTRGAVGVVVKTGALSAGLEKSLPVAFVGVAQIWVLGDGHVSVADFFQRAEAQRGDADACHNYTLDATKIQRTFKGELDLNWVAAKRILYLLAQGR